MTKPALNFQVYSNKHLCDEVLINRCTFDNCRQAIKAECCSDPRVSYHGDSLVINPAEVVASNYNLWIKDGVFSITQVQADGWYSDYTPMAIWLESEGIYNVLVDNCFINGTDQDLGLPTTTDPEANFRNGIVLNPKYETTLCRFNVAIMRPDMVTIPPGHGYIEDVFENGILVVTDSTAEIVTELDPGKYPFRNDKGFKNLKIHGCRAGSGIKVDSGSRYRFSKIGVFDCGIHDNASDGIGILVESESLLDAADIRRNALYHNIHYGIDLNVSHCSVLETAELHGNTIHENGSGGIQVLARGGEAAAQIINNYIYDYDPQEDLDHAGVRLETETASGEPSVLDVTMDKNRIHHLEGTGLVVSARDAVSGALLKVTSSNDRIYWNQGNGISIDNEGSPGPLNAKIWYMTSCNNQGTGITFDDPSPAELEVVNSIFYHNGGDDVGPRFTFSGDISYCDWADGFKDGGAGHDITCISGDPFFADAMYHLQYNVPFPSPCVDSGDNGAAPSISRDMEGDGRIIDGDGDSNEVTDMGADEHDPE